MKRLRLIALGVLLLPVASRGEALPVFAPDGPDASAYGREAGYPRGTPTTLNAQGTIVGSYSHYGDIIASRTIARPPEPSPLPRAPTEIDVHFRWRGEILGIADYLARTPVTGLLVVHDGTILFEHYQYARTDAERLLSQSMAKTVVGLLVGVAIGEGAIHSVDDEVSAYLPELSGTAIGAARLRDLLHMASGIAFEERYDGHDDQAKLSRGLFVKGGPGTIATVTQFGTRDAPPGARFAYKGLDTEVLGLVLARATGSTLSDYASSRLWRKIGAEADATWAVDREGHEVAYCCMTAVLRDWGRLGLLMADYGAWHGTQVVPAQWVRDMTDPSGPFPPDATAHRLGYGYQVWLLAGPRRQFALLGIHGQTILVAPASRLVLVQTAVRLKPTAGPDAPELRALWAALVADVAAP